MAISIHALLAESDCWRATVALPSRNFYPRSPCGERHFMAGVRELFRQISIHALLAESDGDFGFDLVSGLHFYPRSPCGERRHTPSRPPAPAYFYPRSPCGERRRLPSPGQAGQDFYPRSPCGERQIPYAVSELVLEFLSTLSLRRATLVTALCSHSHPHFYPRSPCGERRVVQPRQSPTD